MGENKKVKGAEQRWEKDEVEKKGRDALEGKIRGEGVAFKKNKDKGEGVVAHKEGKG
ncbi:putative forkhead box protein D5-like [Sesbania bispinosa]|nr:putative forkhead box protein D5-like [Sesbania bispinosa]